MGSMLLEIKKKLIEQGYAEDSINTAILAYRDKIVALENKNIKSK